MCANNHVRMDCVYISGWKHWIYGAGDSAHGLIYVKTFNLISSQINYCD